MYALIGTILIIIGIIHISYESEKITNLIEIEKKKKSKVEQEKINLLCEKYKWNPFRLKKLLRQLTPKQ